MTFYHYTCSDHGAPGIRADGVVRPFPAWQRYAPPLVWLTDLPFADADRLGLTARLLDCDRTEVGFEVDAPEAVRWKFWARDNEVPRDFRRALEGFDAEPFRWFVSEVPVAVVREVTA